MGVIRKLALWGIVLLALALPARARAAPLADDRVVFGGTLVLEDGETIDGNLLILGGDVELREGSRVTGNVSLIGGSVRIAGTVDEDVIIVGGFLRLQGEAHVRGDLVITGGSYERGDGARVDGDIRNGGHVIEEPGGRPRSLGQFVLGGLWNLVMLISAAALSVLMATLWPKRLSMVGAEIASNPVMAGGVGLLTIGVAVPLLVLISITLILIPISFIGFLLLAATVVFGLAALSLEVGVRIGEAAGRDWSPGLAAGLGALLLGIIFTGIDQIACIGWATQTMIALIGLGAAVMTRFGGRPYPVLSEVDGSPIEENAA